MWVEKGEPALADSTSPRWGEKASYYSAVCPETGEVEAMAIQGNSNAGTSAAFLGQLRARHRGPLRVYWDNGPAHRGEAIRAFLTPGLDLALANLPAYSPDFNADEAIWAWAREEVTANTCFGTKEKVRAAVDRFLAGLAGRKYEVKRRRRTELHARAEALVAQATALAKQPVNANPTLASV
jgi:transposase